MNTDHVALNLRQNSWKEIFLACIQGFHYSICLTGPETKKFAVISLSICFFMLQYMWCIQSIQSIAAAGRKAIKQFLSSILWSLCSFSHFHLFVNVSPPVFVLICAWQWKTVLNKSGIWKKNGLSLLWNTLAWDALPSVS